MQWFWGARPPRALWAAPSRSTRDTQTRSLISAFVRAGVRREGICLACRGPEAVAQIFNLPYRRIVFGRASKATTRRPFPTPRRVQLCDTAAIQQSTTLRYDIALNTYARGRAEQQPRRLRSSFISTTSFRNLPKSLNNSIRGS